MKTLVLAVGRWQRGDDAAALLLAREVQDELPPDVDLRVSGGDVVELLDCFSRYPAVVIVDAFAADGELLEPRIIEPSTDDLPLDSGCSSHGLGVAEAVDMARRLDCLPDRLLLLAIPGSDFGIGHEPGEAMRQRVRQAKAMLLDLLAGEGAHA